MRRRWRQVWFSLGLLLGAWASAIGLLILGAPAHAWLDPWARWTLVSLFSVILVMRALGILSVHLPENRRLVPEYVFRRGPAMSSLQFGFEMGTGVRTYVTSALPYLLAATVALCASLATGGAAAAGFALGRALMLWTSAVGRDPVDWRVVWFRQTRLVTPVLASSFILCLAGLVTSGV